MSQMCYKTSINQKIGEWMRKKKLVGLSGCINFLLQGVKFFVDSCKKAPLFKKVSRFQRPGFLKIL